MVVKRQERPEIPETRGDCTGDIWELITSCWSHEANDRPSASQVLESLEQFSKSVEESAEPGSYFDDDGPEALMQSSPANSPLLTPGKNDRYNNPIISTSSSAISESFRQLQVGFEMDATSTKPAHQQGHYKNPIISTSSSVISDSLSGRSGRHAETGPGTAYEKLGRKPDNHPPVNLQFMTEQTAVDPVEMAASRRDVYDSRRTAFDSQEQPDFKERPSAPPKFVYTRVSAEVAPNLSQKQREVPFSVSEYERLNRLARSTAMQGGYGEAIKLFEQAATAAKKANLDKPRQLCLANAARCSADARARSCKTPGQWLDAARQYDNVAKLYRKCGQDQEASSAESNAAYDRFIAADLEGKRKLAVKHLTTAAKVDEAAGNIHWASVRFGEVERYRSR